MAEKPARVRDPMRRERILTAAAALMAQHGYHMANLSDIGAEAGIVGSGIYRHFDGKPAILLEFFDRVMDRLICDAEDSLRHAGDGIWTLEHLVTAQVQFTMDERQLYQVYLNEARNLPPADLSRLREKQRSYVGIWQETLLSLRPELSAAESQVLVQAAINVIHSILLYRPALERGDLETLLIDASMRTLGIVEGAQTGRRDVVEM